MSKTGSWLYFVSCVDRYAVINSGVVYIINYVFPHMESDDLGQKLLDL